MLAGIIRKYLTTNGQHGNNILVSVFLDRARIPCASASQRETADFAKCAVQLAQSKRTFASNIQADSGVARTDAVKRLCAAVDRRMPDGTNLDMVTYAMWALQETGIEVAISSSNLRDPHVMPKLIVEGAPYDGYTFIPQEPDRTWLSPYALATEVFLGSLTLRR